MQNISPHKSSIVIPQNQKIYNTYNYQYEDYINTEKYYYTQKQIGQHHSNYLVQYILNNTKQFTHIDRLLNINNITNNGSTIIKGFNLQLISIHKNILNFIIHPGVAVVDGSILLSNQKQTLTLNVNNILKKDYNKIVSVIYYKYDDNYYISKNKSNDKFKLFLYAINTKTHTNNAIRENDYQDWNVNFHNCITGCYNLNKNKDNTIKSITHCCNDTQFESIKNINTNSYNEYKDYPSIVINGRTYPYPNYPSNIYDLINEFKQDQHYNSTKHSKEFMYIDGLSINQLIPVNKYYSSILNIIN